MSYILVDKNEELGFVAELVTTTYDTRGDEYWDIETLYPGSDLGMAISFAVDNAQNLKLELRFSKKVVQDSEFVFEFR